jgi:CRP-like cAMP-binding protein
LAAEGSICGEALFVLEGIASRSKQLSGGRRAVVAFLLPGDFCGLDLGLTSRMDHFVACETGCTIASVSRVLLTEVLTAYPALATNLAAAVLVEGAIQRQWLSNMSSPADKRLAHLLCELRARLARVGLADKQGFFLPLTWFKRWIGGW